MFNADNILREYLRLPKKFPWKAYSFRIVTNAKSYVSLSTIYNAIMEFKKEYYIPDLPPQLDLFDFYKIAIRQEIININVVYRNPRLYANSFGDIFIVDERGVGVMTNIDKLSLTDFEQLSFGRRYQIDVTMLSELKLGGEYV